MKFMNVQDVEKFYNDYKNSISTISKLENRLLKESYSYEKWIVTLKEKSRTLRELFTTNQEEYEAVIGNLVAHPEQLNDELADMFLAHEDFFMSEGYRDYGVTVPVLRILVDYYDRTDDRNKRFDSNYFYALALMSHRCHKEACEYFTRGMKLYGDITECESVFAEFKLLCSYYFRLQSCINMEQIDGNKLLLFYSEAMTMWQRPEIKDIFTDKKLDSIPMIFGTLVAMGVYRMLFDRMDVSDELMDVLESLYEKGSIGVDVVYLRYLIDTGKMDSQAFVQKITDMYVKYRDEFDAGFGYSEWDFIALFDDELLDDAYEADKLFYMNLSFEYIYFLLPEIIAIDRDKYSKTVFKELYRYYSGMPFIKNEPLLDSALVINYNHFLKFFDDEDMLIGCVHNVMIHRQIATPIHSIMVGILAEKITAAIIKNKPELFVGTNGCTNVSEVQDHPELFIDYAKRAGQIHDAGKLMCSDIINLQSRKILDAEFEVIKKHPDAGYNLVRENVILNKYADVVRGHHKSYDGLRGYPEAFDIRTSPYRIFIDIISICDSVDAATDTLGRNYARAKDFETVFEELKAGSGTRYNGDIVSVIEQDMTLRSELSNITANERTRIQYEVYNKYVQPDTEFMPKDEKYVRECNDEDLDEMAAIAGITLEDMRKKFSHCTENSCIMLDGHGKVYGFIIATRNTGTDLKIMMAIIKKGHRRKGYGTTLLKYLENLAHKQGYKRLFMKEVKEGHNDKFGWRSGFTKSEYPGFMVKNI